MGQPQVEPVGLEGLNVPGDINFTGTRIACHDHDGRLISTITGKPKVMAALREVLGAMADQPHWVGDTMSITLQVANGRKHVGVAREFLMMVLEGVASALQPPPESTTPTTRDTDTPRSRRGARPAPVMRDPRPRRHHVTRTRR